MVFSSNISGQTRFSLFQGFLRLSLTLTASRGDVRNPPVLRLWSTGGYNRVYSLKMQSMSTAGEPQ
jgi:hypothetical protein